MGINTTPNSAIVFDISSTNAIRLPKGTIGERPVNNGGDASYKGLIRYNSDQDQFEGFGAGNTWGSLGGVKDVDGNTYISAETSAGADNNELQFFTDGSERMRIGSNGDVSFNHGVNVVGATTMESTLEVTESIGINTTPNSTIVFDISSTNAIRLPKGTIGERPVSNGGDASYKGLIRYNSEQDQFEGFGAGNTWGSLGGVKDVDGNTYISAETSAGADNNELQFFTDGSERMRISADGDVSFNHGVNVVGATTLNSTMTLLGDASMNTALSVGGASTFNSTMQIVGDVSMNNDLEVSGTTTVYVINSTQTIQF